MKPITNTLIVLLFTLLTSCAEEKPAFKSYDQYSSWVNETYSSESVRPDSSLIHKMRYFPKGEYMQIFFKSNRSKGYLYQNVSSSLWKEFKKAPSKGKFYNSKIKPNKSLKIKL